MLTFEQKLKNLATLALRVGVNLQPGQRLILTGPLEAADLMREITRQAYELGAPLVRANYIDSKQELIRALHAHEDTLDEVDLEKLGMNRTSMERGDALLRIPGQTRHCWLKRTRRASPACHALNGPPARTSAALCSGRSCPGRSSRTPCPPGPARSSLTCPKMKQ